MVVIMEVKNLTKQYKMGEVTVDALRGVSFNIYEGEFITVLGPSGSGKSTILNIIGGIDFPTGGEILYKNLPIHTATEKQLTKYRKESVGFVFQFYNLIHNLTAIENVELAAQISDRPFDPEEVMSHVGLSARMDNFPSQLSGGEQQRVSVARALAKKPEIVAMRRAYRGFRLRNR
jgi:putative ABC transport system ATP-binding protein